MEYAQAPLPLISQSDVLTDHNSVYFSESDAARLVDYLEEQDKERIREEVERTKQLMMRYRCALYEIETKFRVLDEQFSLLRDQNPIESIKTRVKSPESIREKLERRGLPLTLNSVENELFDVAGIRIICSFIDDIYLLEKCLLQQDDIALIKRKDYIAHPKDNGYRSLHLVVEVPIFLQNEKRPMKVEVQLRTIAMEFWANLEHKMRYKKNIDEQVSQQIKGELLACAKESAALDARMQWVRKIIDKGHIPEIQEPLVLNSSSADQVPFVLDRAVTKESSVG